MKNKLFQLNNTAFAVIALIIALVIVFFALFFQKKDQGLKITNLENIVLSEMNGKQVKMEPLLKPGEATYICFFSPKDCFNCMNKGINDLISLEKSGKTCLAVGVDNDLDAVSKLADHYASSFKAFYSIKVNDFIAHFTIKILPVITAIKQGKIENVTYLK